MSYEKTLWKNGDIITSQKMNKIEQGIEGSNSSPFVINSIESHDEQAGTDTITLDKTLHEISEKFLSGRICLITSSSDGSTMVIGISVPNDIMNKYTVHTGVNTFSTADEFGYPSIIAGGGGGTPR